jgi:hypothetical protein
MTKITFEDENGTYTIESKLDGMTVTEIIDVLFDPILSAAGYKTTLASYFTEPL